MSGKEFIEYVAYSQIEPFGHDRQDMLAAITPWVLADIFSKKGKSPQFDKFLLSNMLREPGGKPAQSVERMTMTLKGLVESIKAQE